MPTSKKVTPPDNQLPAPPVIKIPHNKKRKIYGLKAMKADELEKTLSGRLDHWAVQDLKIKIIRLLSEGIAVKGSRKYEIETATDAAEFLGVPPYKVYAWLSGDKDFKRAVNLARQVVADRLEKTLARWNNPIPLMMLLKGYRPMYRDTYHDTENSSQLADLVDELKKLQTPKPAETTSESDSTETPENPPS